MKKIANTRKTLTDDIRYVNVVEVADQLIERMRRVWTPSCFSSSSLALISSGPQWATSAT
jgi:hypothetical protein